MKGFMLLLVALATSGCALLRGPSSTERAPAPAWCADLPAFAAQIGEQATDTLDALAATYRDAADSLGESATCSSARLALIQIRPGHDGFDAEAGRARLADVLDADIPLATATRHLLVAQRDTLDAWQGEHHAMRVRTLQAQTRLTELRDDNRRLSRQVEALTSIERTSDGEFE